MRTTRTFGSRLAALVVGLSAATFAAPADAQQVEVPQASPRASVMQQVGITEFQVEYASPGVKGRTIFGGLVPWDEVWRTGANTATKLTASRDFTFGDKAVPAGTYALFTIPGKSTWTVILNADTEQWGAYTYDAKKDVARIEVKPQELPALRERLTFAFADTTNDSAVLELAWDRVGVRVPLRVDTAGHVAASIDGALEKAWQPHYTSARWLLEQDGDLQKALEYIEKSIAVRPTWSNHWVKAQILGKSKRNADAVQAAKAAQKLGVGDRVYENFYARPIDAAIRGWK